MNTDKESKINLTDEELKMVSAAENGGHTEAHPRCSEITNEASCSNIPNCQWAKVGLLSHKCYDQ